MELNEEQQYIIDNIKKGKNVMVDAVAGTGKTTVVLSLAEELSKKNLLQITFNLRNRSSAYCSLPGQRE